MSRSCPSCGSAVDAGVEICPVCGESLVASTEAPQSPEAVTDVPAPIPPDAPIIAAAADPAPRPLESDARQICPECGAANPAGADECSVCGEPLGEAAVARHQTSRPIPREPQASRIYLYAAIGLLVLTGLVFLLSRREEVTSAPRPDIVQGADTAGGALPHNHPPVQDGPPQPTPEQQAQLTKLEADLKSKPNDDTTRLHLADLYYDMARYTDAVPLYRAVLGNESNADLQIKLATAIAAGGDNDGAIGELKRVMEADPKNQEAALTIVVMYVNKRNRDSVGIWLQRVVDIDPNSKEGQDAAMFIEKMKEMTSGTGAPPPAGAPPGGM